MSEHFPEPQPDATSQMDSALLEEAKGLFSLRPLVPYPGWHFDADWENPDLAYWGRRRIWEHFRSRGFEAPLSLKWYDELEIVTYLGNDLTKQIFVGGCIEPNEFVFLDKILRPGMVFIDAGANEGLYSLFAAKRVGDSGRVWAFEPSERELGRLRINLGLNRLTNVRVVPAALAEICGSAELLIADSEHSGQNTLGGFVYSDTGLLRKEVVRLCTLDSLVEREGLKRVDVMKIDVEGAEARLLRGASHVMRSMRPIVIIEILEPALLRQTNSLNDLLGIFASFEYLIYCFSEVTGQPVRQKMAERSGNIIAAPAERPLPDDLYRWTNIITGCPRPGGTHAHLKGPSLRVMAKAMSGAPRTSRVYSGAMAESSGSETSTPWECYLSVVATSRNDDHGGGLLDRMQTFVNAFLAQCSRYSLNAELILVDWNPPQDRPRLAEALQWPEDAGPCRVRIIEVPPDLHRKYKHAENLPLYQMIAKNVGIRRARGRFILATNIDILFDEELFCFLAGGQLRQDKMYRIDRHDVVAGVPVEGSIEERLEYCRSHVLRVNQKGGTFPVDSDNTTGKRAPESAGDDGISFGPGWFPVEQHFGEVFRWAENEAVVEVRNSSASNRAVAFELEPGPSAGLGPLVLRISDLLGRVLGQVTVRNRAILRLVIAPCFTEGRILRFRVVGGGMAVPHDPRVLNFRIFRWEWVDVAWGAAEGIEVIPISVRGRISSFLSRWSRLLRSLRRSEGPLQLGLPLTRALVQKMGLRFDGSGLSIAMGGPLPASDEVARSETRGTDPLVVLHTNACGDFTLMAREHWLDLRGYPEFDAYSFNIDAIFCYAAHYAGVREEVLGEPMRVYHIEHGLGSGWTPEGQTKLFARLAAKGIPFVDWPEVTGWAGQMRRLNCPMIFNGGDWGLGDHDLRETALPAPPPAFREQDTGRG